MDLYLYIRTSVSEILTVVQEAWMQQKTFLNVDVMQHNGLFSIVLLLLKCVAAVYGSKKLVPEIVTVLLICMSVCVLCFIKGSWSCIVIQIINSMVLIAIPREDGIFLVLGYIMIWYVFSVNDKFFLDCYLVVTLFSFICKNYATRLHVLCALMFCLYIAHCLMDQLVGITSSVSHSLLLYYIPVLVLEATGNERGINALPHNYMFLWAVSKLPGVNWSSHAQEFRDLYLGDMTLNDLLDEFGGRKAFLNVDEIDHCVVFYFLLLLKSFMAAYAMKNVLGLNSTIIMMTANWFLSFLDRNIKMVLFGLIHLLTKTGCQIYFDRKQSPLYFSSIFWFLFCFLDDHFHFFLDIFLLTSVVVYIYKAYEGDWAKILSVISILFVVERLSVVFINEKLSWTVTNATLYIPVLMISTFSALNSKSRYLSMAVFISLWLAFRHNKVSFDYCVNKYIYNFYETVDAYIRYLNDELNIRRLKRDGMLGTEL